MNGLSWLLYFGDIVGNLQTSLSIALVISGIVLIGLTIAWCFTLDYPKDDPHPLLQRILVRTLPFWMLVLVIACFIPSKQTIYLIAASETGETVIKSETGKKAVSAINRYLDSVAVDEDKKEEEKK